MTRTLPVSEARESLADLVGRSGRLMDRVVITRNGTPAAVVMGIEEYESWVETLELLSRPRSAKRVREGLADLKAGRKRSFEDVFGEPLRAKPRRR